MNEWMNTYIYIAPVKQKSSEALDIQQIFSKFDYYLFRGHEVKVQGQKRRTENLPLL